MGYALLIVEDPQRRRTLGEEEGRRGFERMERFAQSLSARGLHLGSQALRSDQHGAARVRARDGERLVVDGPFSEAKELIGGFILLNCSTRAEAIAIAQECPAVEWATVEVRELGPCFS